MTPPLDALADRDLDALVLGGGLTGASIARALAARGARVALIEPVDFGWGGSGRSDRLALGAALPGLRHQRVLRAMLRERSILARSARHLVRLVPVLATGAPPPGLVDALGRRVTDALARRTGWPGRRLLSSQQAHLLVPGASLGAGPFRAPFDAIVDDRRLALLVALDARRAGAVLGARCDVVGLESAQPGHAWAEIRDRVTGHTVCVRARSVINATGAWIDRTRRLFDLDRGRALFPLVAAHRAVVLRPADAAVLFPHPRDGRPVTVTPCADGLVASTAPVPVEGVGPGDDGTLIEALAALFGTDDLDLRAGWNAVRPLASGPGLVREAGAGAPFWSVVSGSLLMHRLAARRVAERLTALLGPFKGPRARALGVLAGGEIGTAAGEEAAARATGLTPAQARWVVGRYGALWRDVLSDPSELQALGAGGMPFKVEVRWAVQEESARTLSDLMLRWRVPEIARDADDEEAILAGAEREIAGIFDWSAPRRERERLRWKRERAMVYGGTRVQIEALPGQAD